MLDASKIIRRLSYLMSSSGKVTCNSEELTKHIFSTQVGQPRALMNCITPLESYINTDIFHIDSMTSITTLNQCLPNIGLQFESFVSVYHCFEWPKRSNHEFN